MILDKLKEKKIIIKSDDENKLKHKFSNDYKNLLTAITSQKLNKQQIAYLIYTIICGINFRYSNEIKWLDYYSYFDYDFYNNYLLLTDGQIKLLFIILIEDNMNIHYNFIKTLNYYQLIYLDFVLKDNNFKISNYNYYFNQNYKPLNIGSRITYSNEEVETNVISKLNNSQSIINYIILTFNELFKINLTKEIYFADIKDNLLIGKMSQFKDLINSLSSSDTLKNKIKLFINILDDIQIMELTSKFSS